MTAITFAIFVLTYALIAARKLAILPIGRPGGALFGAVLMITVGAITPEESFQAIDNDTILLLFGMMLMTVYLEEAGFFSLLAASLLKFSPTPFSLLAAVALSSGVLSAFLVNDTVCIFFTPLIVTICLRASLPMGPYLIALATSANIGSAATLVGNPQNMIIGNMSRISFFNFLLYCAPAALLGLAVNILLLWFYYRKKLPKSFSLSPSSLPAQINERRLKLYALALMGIVVGFFAGLHMGYVTLAGVMIIILYQRADPKPAFARVDWPLLIFFCALFIVVAALAKTGIVEETWRAASSYINLESASGLFFFSALMTLGSNIVSNVPMVLLTGPYLGGLGSETLGWALLAFTTTVAGNLTLVGSVANIIVAETAKEHYGLGFIEYLRFGLVSTLLVTALGVPIIYLWVAWLL